MVTVNTQGDEQSFDKNWSSQAEAHYLHWTRNEPANQIQLAFRQHWQTFQPFINKVKGKQCLEVGCGRGSMSAYFADDEWDCTLLDISQTAIDLAQNAFSKEQLNAKFNVGDCLNLPFNENSFDVCFSIGLLEHFADFKQVIAEQVRVLKPGGVFMGYIVPHIDNNVQADYQWMCDILKVVSRSETAQTKAPIYRSDALSPPYIEVMKNLGLNNIFSSGIYSLPMISHSIEFPFTLLPPEAEKILVEQFKALLAKQQATAPMNNPWLCDEHFGQAVLVCGYK